ncbi:MAG: CTP synthase, partial [Spirochaetia bacterium]|nr:CTP synthase [Spirochaetia bacterium]
HSKTFLNIDLNASWISTEDITEKLLKQFQGLWIGTGSPYKNMANALFALEYSRKKNIPTFGTCGGFQHMMLEYVRNVLGFSDAEHAEYDPYASKIFISELECSLRGREMELKLTPNSRVANFYGKTIVKEKYYCNFGINPEYVDLIRNGPFHIVGSDSEGEIRIIENPDHNFFIGTLFVPQVMSTEKNPHPLVTGFINSIFSDKT